MAADNLGMHTCLFFLILIHEDLLSTLRPPPPSKHKTRLVFGISIRHLEMSITLLCIYIYTHTYLAIHIHPYVHTNIQTKTEPSS